MVCGMSVLLGVLLVQSERAVSSLSSALLPPKHISSD